MNPFKMRPERTGDLFVDWEKFWVKPYNKNEVNPYTRTRIILMNGTEFVFNVGTIEDVKEKAKTMQQ